MRFYLLWSLFFLPSMIRGQDTSQPWFEGGDEGFYEYLSSRFMALGHDKPFVNRNGEPVVFDFTVSDSGRVDSVHITQCFQSSICIQLRLILNTMPRVNADVVNGKTVAHRRVYSLILRNYIDGYRFEENNINPSPQGGSTSSQFKWIVALTAIIAMIIVVVK